MACSQTDEVFSEGKTFTYVFERKTFSEANQYCINNYDGSLAIADDEDTLRALLPGENVFPIGCLAHYFWIGLKKENGSLVWINEQQPSDYIRNVKTTPLSQTTCSRYVVEPLKTNQSRKNIDVKLGEVDCGTSVSFICERAQVTTSSKQPTISIPAEVSTTLAETRRTIPSTPHRSSVKDSSVPNRKHTQIPSDPTKTPSNVSPTVSVSPAKTPTPVTTSQAGTSNSNMGVIIGSVVGGIALLAILLIIFLLVWKRKRSGTSQCGKNHKPVNDSDCSENSASSNPVAEPAHLAAGESSTAGGLSSEYLSVSERAVPATESDYDHLRRDVQDNEELVAYAEINRNNKTKSETSFSERPTNTTHASRRESSQEKEISNTVNKLESLSLNEDSNTEIKDLYSTVNKPKQLTSDNDAKTSDAKDLYSAVQNKKK